MAYEGGSVPRPHVAAVGGVVACGLLAWAGASGRLPVALLPALAVFAVGGSVLALIDMERQRLPDAIVLPGYPVLGVLVAAASWVSGDWGALIGACAGAVVTFGLYLMLALVHPSGMGGGDVKLSGLIGLVVGWLGVGELVVGVVAGFAVGALVGATLIVARRVTRRTGVPFGPSMLAGAWLGIVAGPAVAEWSLALSGLA